MHTSANSTAMWSALPADDVAPDPIERAPLKTRIHARVFASRLDDELVRGAEVEPGSALAVHAARLSRQKERAALADALRRLLWPRFVSPGSVVVRVDRAAVEAARDHVHDVLLRLHAPRPVRAPGVARLRMLMADGTGPFYVHGRGDLTAGLKAVLAEM